MCWPSVWPEDMTPEHHIGLQAPSTDLTALILEYIRLSRRFDASNIFDAELNIAFGRLNYIEQLILSKEPKKHKLFANFSDAKSMIDLLINPNEPKAVLPVAVKTVTFEAPQVTSYKVKNDSNKKKYRSVLVVTRTDTTGFEAMRKEPHVGFEPTASCLEGKRSIH